ncbi:hypothetical protein GQ44DRAFT_711975 [Phaeosphaeriaceae sp. PMI808]|nr:hypothetical protein GQ44DRAFT_711975 [Phaeosphaeriaceae sp. PMI808]
MSFKRDHGLAFPHRAPTVRPNLFDTSQPQQQEQSAIAPSPSSLFVPGQWPSELNSESGPLVADESASTGAVASSTGSLFHTVGKWAATVAIPNLFALPAQIALRFCRRQKLLVQPIVREDGARKKRIIDAGVVAEPGTPTPTPRAQSRATLLRRIPNRRVVPTTTTQPETHQPPDFWFPGSSNGPRGPTTVAGNTANSDSDIDDGLDDSWSDLLASSTPPRGPVPDWAARGRKSSTEHQRFSPNTHRLIIASAPVTPMRRSLVKRQLGVFGVSASPTSPAKLHTVPSPKSRAREPSELQKQSIQASVLKINAAAVADNAQQASEQHKAQTEARRNSNPDIAAVVEQINDIFAETVDVDLSTLPDAPEYDEEVIAHFSPRRHTPKRKSVTWSDHATAKAFYCDEIVAEMLDTTLESVVFSPMRPIYEDAYDDTSEDDAQEASESSPSANNSPTYSPNQLPTVSVGFTGVPENTWEDSEDSLNDFQISLHESQISYELLSDLQEDLQKKLALEPTPPPPAVIKALVTPLSSEEKDRLDAAAAKTEYGRIPTAEVVGQKLSAHDFGTLLPDQFCGDRRAWLNDNIVNEYMSILVGQMKKEAGFEHKRGGPAPSVHAFSSFWYTTIKSRPKGVERWAARFQLAGQQYLDAELILYPICDGGHWRLLVVKPKDRTIEYLDSLGGPGGKYINTVKEYLAKELGVLYIESEWIVVEKQRSTRQVNGSDCGIFTVLNALALLRGEQMNRVLACDGMQDARERVAITLMNGSPTTELE